MKKLLIIFLGIQQLYAQVSPDKTCDDYEKYIYSFNDSLTYEACVMRKSKNPLFKDRVEDIHVQSRIYANSIIKEYLFSDDWFSNDLLIGKGGGGSLKKQPKCMTMSYFHFQYIPVFFYNKEKYYVQDHLMYLYKVKMTKTMLKDSSYLYHYTFKGRLPQSKVGDILHKVSESRHHPRWRKKLEIDVSPEWGIVGYNCYSKKGKLMARVKLISVDGMPFKLE